MTKNALISLITLLTLSIGVVKAQDSTSYIKLNQDESIALLLQKHIQVNEYRPWVDGYRVQLFSVTGVNSKDKANRFKAEFLMKHPKADVYIVYQAPYFKVRIGNFRYKIEALSYLKSINKQYSNGIVVVDKIQFTNNEDEGTNE